ncbi:unnamed protein product [Blepharisma stoltei]|uniref:Uncharacterized protein n=1 Tax=Blepharisma stoltei TaxID=1481888 RepID=A0AAU9JT09_9CILI|nr:unnamed protein product [Blepharisma stoltei]
MAQTNFIERFKNKVSTIGKSGEIEIDPAKPILKANSAQFHKSIMQLSASNIIRNNLQSPKPDTFVSARPIKVAAKDDSPTSPKTVTATFSAPLQPEVINGATPNISQSRNPDQNQRRNYSHSATPFRKPQVDDVPKTSDGITQSFESRYAKKQGVIDFSPYTLTDYHMIKNDKYYELGGLGAVNIGTEEWIKRKEMQDRRVDYAKQVKYINAASLPPSGAKKTPKITEKVPSKMQRANEFAKNIPKPQLKIRNDSIEGKENPSEKDFSPLEYQLDKHDSYRTIIDEIKANIE